MDIQDLIDVYRKQGLEALNKVLSTIKGNSVSILEHLEGFGFTIKWHYYEDETGERDDGVVIDGPSGGPR
jgi:hypothetical protein